MFWFAADKLPDVRIEGTEFLLNSQKCPGVGDGGGDLEPVADDAGIGEQALDVTCGKARHFLGNKAGKGAAVVFALVEDSFPAQAGLRAFENKELEEKV